MRLLYLSPTASMGGAERVLLDLLGMVRAAQPSWTVGLIVANDGPLARGARALGVTTIVMPFPREFARIGDAGLAGFGAWVRFVVRAMAGTVAMLRYVRRLRQEIAAFNPDVVHSNGIKMHLLGALARPARAALIWHFHDYLGSRRVASQVIRQLKNRCNAIIAVSESVAADIRRQLGRDVEISTMWNAVDLGRFPIEGPRLDLDAMAGLPSADPDVVRVGLVATFARWKGHLMFLDVMRAVTPRHRVRGYIVGGPLYETDGSQYSLEELRMATSRLGLSSLVGLTGFVNDPAAALRSLDIVVHASTLPEPFGLVIAEAMATGRPVIVSEGGGVAEFVSKERDALTYPQANAKELARQLERLIEDADLRRQLGTAAHQAAVERFNPVRVTAQILGLYARLRRPVAA